MHRRANGVRVVNASGRRARCVRISAWAIAISSALGISRAQAADRHLPGLNYVRLEGAEQCATAAGIAKRVEARVRRLAFGAVDEADVFVDGFVRRTTGGWDVQLAVSTPDGRVWGRRDMHFDGDDCAIVDEAVALVIAVTLNPESGLGAGIALEQDTLGRLDALFGSEPSDLDPANLPPAAESGDEFTSPSEADQPLAAASDPERSPEVARWRLNIDAVGFGALGHLPGASVGIAGHVQVIAPQLWPIEIGVALFRPRTAAARGETSGRGSFGLVLGSLAVCPWTPLAAFALCGGAELGVLHAETSGFEETQPTSNAIVANAVAVGIVRVHLTGSLQLRFGLTAAMPLVQHRYSFRAADATSGQLYRMSQVAGRAEIGAGWSF
jgi:hypothetical protein